MSDLNHQRLRDFVAQLAALLEQQPDEATILARGSELLRPLLQHDDWLDDTFAQPHPQHYQQYLLHADAQQRFSVVSFV